jgi:hypothetical protein
VLILLSQALLSACCQWLLAPSLVAHYSSFLSLLRYNQDALFVFCPRFVLF